MITKERTNVIEYQARVKSKGFLGITFFSRPREKGLIKLVRENKGGMLAIHESYANCGTIFTAVFDNGDDYVGFRGQLQKKYVIDFERVESKERGQWRRIA